MDWSNMSFPYYDNMTRHAYNSSLDVLAKNCFTDYDTLACVRSTLLCFLYGLTCIVCIARIIRLHLVRYTEYYPYMVFYIATAQSLIGTVEWVVGWKPSVSLICAYLGSFQLLVVTHFYAVLVFRIFQRHGCCIKFISYFVLALMFGFFTAVFMYGQYFAQSTRLDCKSFHWLLLASGQGVVVQFLVVCCILLYIRMSAVCTEREVKQSQRRDLALVVLIFEFAAALNITYHTCMLMLTTDEIGCSGVFLHRQAIYSSVKTPMEIFTVLMPNWLLLWIFRPTRKQETLLAHSESQNNTEPTLLDPTLLPPSIVQQWRRGSARFLRPPTNVRVLQDGYRSRIRRAFVPRNQQSRADVVRKRLGFVRRALSMPHMVRRTLSPALAPIPEEDSMHSAASSVRNSPPCSAPHAGFDASGEAGSIHHERRTSSSVPD